MLLFLAIPWELIYIFDVSQLTARFSASILWLLGFSVTRQDVWIILPTGSVEVYNGCSGVLTILQLLGLSWIVLTLMPTDWRAKVYLPLASILLGFDVKLIEPLLNNTDRMQGILVATLNRLKQ